MYFKGKLRQELRRFKLSRWLLRVCARCTENLRTKSFLIWIQSMRGRMEQADK